jgi:hypothetical protein
MSRSTSGTVRARSDQVPAAGATPGAGARRTATALAHADAGPSDLTRRHDSRALRGALDGVAGNYFPAILTIR